MADTFTMDEAPADAPELNADEQESLAIGQEMAAEQQGLLAGKYSNAQDLENAYLELQKKLGTANAEESGEEVVEKEVAEDDDESLATSFLNDASSEFAENGSISEETMAVLQDMSSEDLVSAYIEMQGNAPQTATADLTEKQISSIHDYVGGEAEYTSLLTWASQNLDQDSIDAFDSVVEQGNEQAIKLASAGLKSIYESQNGSEGTLLTGKAPSTAGETFRSQAEVVSAMSDPRYDRDEAYREEVIRKLEKSGGLF